MARGGTYIRGFMAGLSLRPLPKRNFCFVYPFLISWFVSLGGTCFNYFCFLFFFLYGIDFFFLVFFLSLFMAAMKVFRFLFSLSLWRREIFSAPVFFFSFFV